MSAAPATTTTEGLDLILARTFSAPPAKVFDAWTQPAPLTRWFAPLPWTTVRAALDVRVGGK